MNQRKHGARLLGLLAVAVLGVMAFAGSVQAATPKFELKLLELKLLVPVGAEQIGTGSMAVTGLNFELNCKKFKVEEAHIETGGLDGKGTLSYTECTTLSITKLPEEIHCHVKEPVKAEALLLPAETTGGAPAILAEKIKALITLHLPEGVLVGVEPCVLPLDNTVTGEVCLAIDNNDTATLTVLASASIECRVRNGLEGKENEGSTKDVLKYGAQTAVLTGAAKVFLTGAHSGLEFGVRLF
jgi:hypothetical protein